MVKDSINKYNVKMEDEITNLDYYAGVFTQYDYITILIIGMNPQYISMLREYFYNAHIYGWNIDDDNLLYNIDVYNIDLKNSEVIESRISDKNYDIIIDATGSLNLLMQIFNKLNKRGIYVLENASNDILYEKYLLELRERGCVLKLNGTILIIDKLVNSFDLFDTLIFRAGKSPNCIFELMGKTLGENFIKDRYLAEKRSKDKTLDDIYLELQKIYGWSDTNRTLYMKAEMDTEYNNIYPIIENVRQVEKDDIIISDMYLPHKFLSKLLYDKCGLSNRLIVTYDGKYKGDVWDTVKPIGQHLGDNPKTDGESPKLHGIGYSITSISGYTENEAFWVRNSYTNIANLMRFCRLQCPYDRGLLYDLFHINILYNIPTLLMFSYYIHEIVVHGHYNKIAFSTRDCCYLYVLYKKLFPTDNTCLFLSSRYCYYNPDEEYDLYVKNTIPPNTLIIDIQGSGKSYKHYFEHIDYETSILFLSDKIKPECELLRLLPEYMNQVRFGTVRGVKGGRPILNKLEYPQYIVYPTEKVTHLILSYLSNYSIDIDPDFHILRKYVRQFQHITLLKNFSWFHSNHKSIQLSQNDKDFDDFLNIFDINHEFPQSENLNLQKDIDISIPVYIINHEDAQKRLIHMYDLLKKLDIKNIKIIRPYPITQNLDEKLANLLNISTHNIQSSSTHLSHSLTYLNILQSAPETQIIIFEDDIVPINSIEDTKIMLEFIIKNTPNDADMIYFEYCNEDCEYEKNIFNRLKTPYCTGGIYYPNKSCRDKIINCFRNYHISNIYRSTDNTLASLINMDEIIAYEHKPIFMQDGVFNGGIAKPLCKNKLNEDVTIYPLNSIFIYYNQYGIYFFITIVIIVIISLIILNTISTKFI